MRFFQCVVKQNANELALGHFDFKFSNGHWVSGKLKWITGNHLNRLNERDLETVPKVSSLTQTFKLLGYLLQIMPN